MTEKIRHRITKDNINKDFLKPQTIQNFSAEQEKLRKEIEDDFSKTYVKKKVFPVDLFVDFIVAYTPYNKEQAHNIISGIISDDELPLDVMRLCLHLKRLSEAQDQITQLANGARMLRIKGDELITIEQL